VPRASKKIAFNIELNLQLRRIASKRSTLNDQRLTV